MAEGTGALPPQQMDSSPTFHSQYPPPKEVSTSGNSGNNRLVYIQSK